MAYIGPEPNPGQNREVDDISSGFNGSEVNFTLQVNSQNVSPGSANSIIVSLGGVVQNPGTDYTVAASTLTFTTAPANGLSFFGLVLGQQIDTEGTADGSITLSKFVNGTASNNGKFLRANNGAIPSFETVSGTTINNNANNKVITGSDTANTLEAESNVIVDSSGNMLIGATSYSGGGADPKLYVSGTSGRTVKIHGGSATSSLQLTNTTSGEGEDEGLQIFESGANAGIFNKESGDLTLGTNNTAVLTIQQGNDGSNDFKRVLIGTTVETFAMVCLKVHAGNFQPLSINDSSNTSSFTSRIGFRTGNNQVGTIKSSSSATQYNTSSDYRLKENASPISDGITRIKTLKPYKFNWISDETNTPVDGFFAHEVSSVVPEAISGTKDKVADDADVARGDALKVGDPVYQEIDQSKLVPLLTAALQEAISKIETLETKVAALEAA